MSMRWWGTAARSAADAFAVPMSMPRYTCAESTLTISIGCERASARASRDLPLAVGPSRAKAAGGLPASGGIDDRPRRVRGLVREQPEDCARDLVGLAAALHRNAVTQALEAVRLAARGVDAGI